MAGTGRKPLVLFVEDEAYLRAEFPAALRNAGYDVLVAPDPDEACQLISQEDCIDALVTDVQMRLAPGTQLSQIQTRGGQWAGVALADVFRRRFPDVPIVFWTSGASLELRRETDRFPQTSLVGKDQEQGWRLVMEELARWLHQGTVTRPRIFLVHGHDHDLLKSVSKLITNDFKLPTPVILRDQASSALTLIEKFERDVLQADLVIAMLTPDDEVVYSDGRRAHRARQNVIFEIGFFMGKLGRHKGRIVILHRGQVELPSDIHGIVTIDVTGGLDAAKAHLKEELKAWLPTPKRRGRVAPKT